MYNRRFLYLVNTTIVILGILLVSILVVDKPSYWANSEDISVVKLEASDLLSSHLQEPLIIPEQKPLTTNYIDVGTPIPVVPGEEPISSGSTSQLIESYILEVSDLYTFDPAIVHSMIWHESRYDPKAKNGVCLGLMQVSKKWHSNRAERLGVTDFYDPYSNILLGVDYISELYDQTGDIGLALMMYNMSHDKARDLYEQGELSWYATSVLERAEKIRLGVID